MISRYITFIYFYCQNSYKFIMMSKEEKIKAALATVGFDEVRITSAEPLRDDARRFRAWLDEGHAANMSYLQRNSSLRSDPGLFLGDAKSVIVAGAACPPAGNGEGPVATFGLYPDYHDLLRAGLEKGMETIAKIDGTSRSRPAVDASPLLERALACRAGLGRIGYSTNLLTPRFGPFVLLGTIVTTLPLIPDHPLDDLSAGGPSGELPSGERASGDCVSCGRCIKDCPTGALLEPRVLDAARCISYLTIEKKGPFTDQEASAVGGWAFGCDICSRACFKRQGQSPFPEEAGVLMRGRGHPMPNHLETLLDFCERGFKKSFRGSPLFRCGKGGLIRNILTAAKNLNLPWVSERAIPHLKGGTEASRRAAERAIS